MSYLFIRLFNITLCEWFSLICWNKFIINIFTWFSGTGTYMCKQNEIFLWKHGSRWLEHETYFLLESNCCVYTFFEFKEWSHSINLTTFGHHMFICIFEKIIKCKYVCSIKRMNNNYNDTTIIVFWSYGRKYFMFFFKKYQISYDLWHCGDALINIYSLYSNQSSSIRTIRTEQTLQNSSENMEQISDKDNQAIIFLIQNS